MSYIHSNRLTLLKTGAYTPEQLVTEERKLNEGLISLQSKEQVSDIAMRETMKDVLKTFRTYKKRYAVL